MSTECPGKIRVSFDRVVHRLSGNHGVCTDSCSSPWWVTEHRRAQRRDTLALHAVTNALIPSRRPRPVGAAGGAPVRQRRREPPLPHPELILQSEAHRSPSFRRSRLGPRLRRRTTDYGGAGLAARVGMFRVSLRGVPDRRGGGTVRRCPPGVNATPRWHVPTTPTRPVAVQQ